MARGRKRGNGVCGRRGESRQNSARAFFAHLAVEKVLKALVIKKTNDLAPRIHDLVKLAKLAGLNFSKEQIETLGEMNRFSLEGRYPETWGPTPNQEQGNKYLADAKEVFEWLAKQL